MRRIHILLPALLGLLALPSAWSVRTATAEPPRPAKAEEVAVPTPRKVDLKATLHRPSSSNGAAVVLAPGAGYHRGKPLLMRSAEALADAGFTVLRFDWAYFTAGGKPSDDLKPEREDLDAALAYAHRLAGVKQVLLAGKSLGSFVALQRAAAESTDLAGVALLTFPVEADPDHPGTLHPEAERLTTLSLPVLIVHGDSDPLGRLATLYALMARCKTAPSVVIVPGDHGFGSPSKSEAETAENVELAAHALTVWAKRRLAP